MTSPAPTPGDHAPSRCAAAPRRSTTRTRSSASTLSGSSPGGSSDRSHLDRRRAQGRRRRLRRVHARNGRRRLRPHARQRGHLDAPPRRRRPHRVRHVHALGLARRDQGLRRRGLRDRRLLPRGQRFLVERDLRASHFEVDTFVDRADDRPELLRGDGIVLRPLRADDVERVAEIQSQPGVLRWWGPPNEAELRRQAEGHDEAKALAIEREGELVGLIQYHEENEPDFRHASIDLFLAETYQGRGLGSDAVRTLGRYLIGERGHHRLTIDPAADNVAAIRAYEKVGFRPVGRMREYWRSPEGSWHDGLLMDLLARELRT